ncbi:superoxide dismutase family protein [bacterium]|nr:superoxide dismutase family protein [bacterium]
MPDGVAVLQPDGSDVRGVVRFTERSDPYGYEGVTIQYRITGLTDGEHGFHIHRYGDLTDGCTSACEHFDPQTQLLESKLAEWVDALDLLTGGGGGFDAGQERVIYVGRSRFPHSEKQILKQISKISNQLSRRHHGGLDTRVRHFGDLGNITSSDGVAEGELFLAKGILDNSRYGILGRMIIVHADRDDLGEGGDEESLKTGNAGKRLACGVIGLADPNTDTMTMDAEDDWVDHFLPGPNINPHDDPAYDEPYVKCDSNYDCPDPARTGPFHYSGGYIGKVTACRECWQAMLEHYEEEFQGAVEEDDGDDFEDPTDSDSFRKEWAAEGDNRSVPRNWDLIMSDPHADMGLYPNGQPRLPPLDDIPVAESLDDLRNILRNRGNLAIIGFPLTAYRGVASDAHWRRDTGERYDYLSTLDGGVIGGRCGGLAVLGPNSNTPPVSIDLSVALDFAIGQKSSIASMPPDYGIQLTKPITYSIDLQDYLVQDIRLDSSDKALGVPGGIHIDDAIPLMEFGEYSSIYASETIDDLDDESLMIRMENLAERMDAIVQRIGSYPDAERDPEYLRLVEQHIAYARVLARRHGFGAESDSALAFRYMPESAYHRALEKGYMEPHGYHGATLATLDPTPTFYQTDGWYDSGHPLSDIYQIDLTGLQYRHHQVSAPQGQVILIEGDIPVDQIQPISYSYANDGFDAESDPVSSVAAGTTDALNDFANSQDTDDKFYFLGGLVGGLAIAVLGNIISDRLQDVYFPHWWENRGGSQS